MRTAFVICSSGRPSLDAFRGKTVASYPPLPLQVFRVFSIYRHVRDLDKKRPPSHFAQTSFATFFSYLCVLRRRKHFFSTPSPFGEFVSSWTSRGSPSRTVRPAATLDDRFVSCERGHTTVRFITCDMDGTSASGGRRHFCIDLLSLSGRTISYSRPPWLRPTTCSACHRKKESRLGGGH